MESINNKTIPAWVGEALLREAEGFKHTIGYEVTRIASVVQFLSEAVENGHWNSADSYVHTLIQQANQLRALTGFVARTNQYESQS
jgi:hypothetical protein